MDSDIDENLPIFNRRDSPDTVFDNEFTDSGDETEENDSSQEIEGVHSTKGFSGGEPPLKYKANLIEDETCHASFKDESKTDAAFDWSNSAIYADFNRHACSTLCGSDPVVEDENKNKHRLTDTDWEKFASGWLLEEKDLICLPLVLNKGRQQEFEAQKLHQDQSVLKRPYSDKGHRVNTMRLLRKRAGKGSSSSRLVYMTPLSMIANIAKRSGYDLTALLETSEYLVGKDFQLPCMQCYENFGGKGGTGFDYQMGATSGEAGNSSGRCQTCGGQVQTLASFGKMIKQMREILDTKDLVPYDVYPDGNCLFGAIVDQLRLRGDFSFTSHSLRLSAVNYLRKNPSSDDGTPLHMFLTEDETWDSYLSRMSEDGEWGDHIILRALSNVIDKQIVIYGGMSGQTETILSPNSLTDEKMSCSKDESQEDFSVIYLGHVGESHYLSLRPKQWRESLRKGLQKRREAMKFKYSDTAEKQHNMMKCPVQYINFILRQVFRMDFIKSSCSEVTDMLVPSRHETKDSVNELFGPVMCKLVPEKVKVESFEPDISIFFPSVNKEATKECFKTSVVCCVYTPKDTNVVTTMDSAKSVDLFAENDAVDIGRAVLIPKRPKLWTGQTESLNMTKNCLKTFDIDMDFFDELLPKKSKEEDFLITQVLGFKCAWPDVAKEWPDRHRESAFPDLQTIQTVVETGCHVIPLIPNEKMADIFDDPVQYMTSTDNHSWCYSFVAAEKEISRFLSSEQRQCYLIFKALVDGFLTDIPISSSVARSIFFYACEKLDKQIWKSNPGECLLVLLKKLSDCFKNRSLPHYYMQEKNLLQFIPEITLDECFHRLECARLQPVVSLYFLLDQLNVMSSGIGGFVEEIIENTIIEGQTNAKVGLSNRLLLPACTELIQSLIYQEDYHGAMLVFQDVIEEIGGSLETDGVAEMKRLLWNLHIGFQWCFALYIDIQKQTAITAQLCEGYVTFRITEIFGPDCTKELPDTLVPECFSIHSGDLMFPRKVSTVLSQNVSDNMYIGCMKFFLKEYAKIAGEALVIPSNLYGCHCTAGGKCKTKTTVSSALYDLQEIYVVLFNFCLTTYKTEEFREMMPVYTTIAETIGSRVILTNLYRMWTFLGERKKAAEVLKKLKDSSVFSTVAVDFSEYDLD